MLTVFLKAGAQTEQIYVSVAGSDQNKGTFQNPLKTLENAITRAEKLKGKKVNIFLKKGTYYLGNTIKIYANRLRCSSLSVSALNNQKVILSAGRALKLRWEKFKGGIYKAKVPAGIQFERLFINDKAQTMARYPNYSDTARVYHGTSADAISPERIKRWKDPVGGYIHALHRSEWGSFDYLITGVNRDGSLNYVGGWQNNRPSPMNEQYRFVEDIFEELDAPGEWFLDKRQNVLYYYPVKGLNVKRAKIVVSHLKNTVEVLGKMEEPAKNVTLSRLVFTCNERTFMDTREPLVRSDWSIYRGGAVLFDGTENCNIKDCKFEGLGGNAILFSNYNKRDTVIGCLVDHIGASAVCFVGDPKAVRSPLFKYEATQSYTAMDKTPGPLTNNYPQECVVTDNLFHDLGEIEKQATGVQITLSSGITVSHNSIYNLPRAGININDGCWGGHILAYNDVFNTVLETGDHGAFNSWGRDRYWSADRSYMDSLVKKHPQLVLLDAQKTNQIHDNRFRCDHGWDIDLDDGSSNYHIYNNVCLNGGIKLREGFYRIVDNNILINNTFHPHVWFKKSGDEFEHNIVMKSYQPVAIKDWGSKVDSNFFSDTAALIAAHKNGTDQHSVAGKLVFADDVSGNYTVTPGSDPFLSGFKNIPMNEFGVQKPELKKLAQQPKISPMISASLSDLATKGDERFFLGGKIKSVIGQDERSAYGLPSAHGVIIISAGNDSLAAKGLQSGDVITGINNIVINTVGELVYNITSLTCAKIKTFTIYRNQKILNITITRPKTGSGN